MKLPEDAYAEWRLANPSNGWTLDAFKAGWAARDAEARVKPAEPDERCAYPDCGCDWDEVCDEAIP